MTTPNSDTLTGWAAQVYGIVMNLPQEFTTQDVYGKEAKLAKKFPENNNVRAKIRQQLQVLRDKGFIAQGEKKGTWHKKVNHE